MASERTIFEYLFGLEVMLDPENERTAPETQSRALVWDAVLRAMDRYRESLNRKQVEHLASSMGQREAAYHRLPSSIVKHPWMPWATWCSEVLAALDEGITEVETVVQARQQRRKPVHPDTLARLQEWQLVNEALVVYTADLDRTMGHEASLLSSQLGESFFVGMKRV